MKKHLKLLSLAAVAALALMAMVGASSASAKVCSGAGTGAACAAGHGNVYTGEIFASLSTGKTAVLTSGFVNVTCKSSSFRGEVTNGETGAGNISSLTFGECSNNLGQECTASTTASNTNKWAANARTGTAPNGFMEVENVHGEFTCGSTICIYAKKKVGEANEIAITGGAPATATATKVPLEKQPGSNALCSATAQWDGTYTVSTPSSLYLT